ncbi:hypothetical protein NEOLI_000634 [Neolecta irregularis DAH-3]|uniref:Uncharacterized protein n=1 Tax=Neolecta irregularis (strain DAH-3) TaxID=1198029 RepID=A0A1U7LU34_NEOID|nr:hypothetical protein NEOLI_000634 [Neolecta irregularis DAH-3]|eukprot:OLL26128.1 hypothetical protein NEOLI_000634 [Neolecta irregularis DAH-3]
MLAMPRFLSAPVFFTLFFSSLSLWIQPISPLPVNQQLGSPQTPEYWEKQTDAACLSAMTSIPHNPVGILACYNVISMNLYSGRFTAELRLYQAREFIGVDVEGRQKWLSIQFDHSTLTESGINTSITKRNLAFLRKRQLLTVTQKLDFKLIQIYTFEALVNNDETSLSIDNQHLVTPRLSIIVDLNQKQTSFDLNSSTIQFIAGVFSNPTAAQTSRDPSFNAAHERTNKSVIATPKSTNAPLAAKIPNTPVIQDTNKKTAIATPKSTSPPVAAKTPKTPDIKQTNKTAFATPELANSPTTAAKTRIPVIQQTIKTAIATPKATDPPAAAKTPPCPKNETLPIFIPAHENLAVVASPSPAKFVLPGRTFGIVPISFYLFNAYWFAFTAIILVGACFAINFVEGLRKKQCMEYREYSTQGFTSYREIHSRVNPFLLLVQAALNIYPI